MEDTMAIASTNKPAVTESSNPEHQLTPDVLNALKTRQKAEADWRALSRRAGDATQRNREAYSNGLKEAMTSALGPLVPGLPAFFRKADELHDTYHANLQASVGALIEQRLLHLPLIYGPGDHYHDPFPQPVDSTFWWARSVWDSDGGHRYEMRSDGLHVWGGPTQDHWGGENSYSFGSKASFALSPDRFPPSPNARFVSQPWVELFGGVRIHAPRFDVLQGDGIARCDLYLRHTLFQYAFGPSGPEPRILGEAIDGSRIWMEERNTGSNRLMALPGYVAMPPVTVRGQFAPESVWAEVEVRFNIHLESNGAFAWCDPEVLLRTYQWALVGL